ncbi:MAG: thiol-disulfide isomerase, partial [Deltaproteobacteria bacterium]
MAAPKKKALEAKAEAALKEKETATYVLRLYIAGTTPRSLRAVANVKAVCEEHLKDRYELEVIDL